MGKRRSRYDIPGRRRFTERNPRGKKAQWVSFACTRPETDAIMQAIGMAGDHDARMETPAGTLLARVCREWIGHHQGTCRRFMCLDRNGKEVYEGDRVGFEPWHVEDVFWEDDSWAEGVVVYLPEYGRFAIDIGAAAIWKDAPLDEWGLKLIGT